MDPLMSLQEIICTVFPQSEVAAANFFTLQEAAVTIEGGVYSRATSIYTIVH